MKKLNAPQNSQRNTQYILQSTPLYSFSSQPLNSQAIEQKQVFLQAPSSSNPPHLPRIPTSPSLPPTLTPTQLPSQPQNQDPALQSAPKSRSRRVSHPNSQFNQPTETRSQTSQPNPVVATTCHLSAPLKRPHQRYILLLIRTIMRLIGNTDTSIAQK